ncbi:ABC transporter family substrate-binding protein [Streptomyces sp. 6N223]|uniref:ABC transporter family substrate-binding protein n=1 Tax=Streptomyces sp. 6N223 TaxID=3457412 RepID=UPI003FCF0F64
MAVVLGGALALSACTSDSGSDEEENNGEGGTSGPSGTVTLASDQPFQTYNNTTASGNTVADGLVLEGVHNGFWTFGEEDGGVIRNEDFGTFEKTSDDPLTVEYHLNDEAVWSDGDPIDCDDVILWWTQNSGAFDGLFSAGDTGGIEDTEMPDCAPGGKDFTLVYDQPYADWEANGPSNGNTTMMPAHVVAEKGGFDSPEAFLEALRGDDKAVLQDAATFFNEGWLIDGALPDPGVIPSAGPWVISGYEANSSVTLTPNERWWGEPPGVESIVVRQIPLDEQVAALQNGEVDIISPQPDVDIATQIEGLSDMESYFGFEYVYEHLDFNFNEGPFADSLPLRQAFALCVPRQQIVDNLIKPVVGDDAEVLNTRNVQPSIPGYEESLAASQEYIDEFGTQDIDRARQILQDEGAMGTTVRLSTLDNPRRNNAGQLIEDSCNEAGFDVQFTSALDFFDRNGDLQQNNFDVAMFAWSGSPLRSGWNSTYRTPISCTPDGKANNNGCYSSEEMDQLLDDILRTSDEQEANDLTAQIEALTWEDMVTLPLYSHPAIDAWNPRVQNVVPNPSQNGIVWNADQWTVQ